MSDLEEKRDIINAEDNICPLLRVMGLATTEGASLSFNLSVEIGLSDDK